MPTKEEIAARVNELQSLSKGGLLKPEAVVNHARDPSSALHACFEWDDTVAAHQHRLWQARQLIVRVTVVPAKGREPVQAFVSLSDDRQDEGGGYRATVSVMSDPARRAQLLAEAMADLDRLRAKYRGLEELAAVFQAAEEVETPRKSSKTAAGVGASR